MSGTTSACTSEATGGSTPCSTSSPSRRGRCRWSRSSTRRPAGSRRFSRPTCARSTSWRETGARSSCAATSGSPTAPSAKCACASARGSPARRSSTCGPSRPTRAEQHGVVQALRRARRGALPGVPRRAHPGQERAARSARRPATRRGLRRSRRGAALRPRGSDRRGHPARRARRRGARRSARGAPAGGTRKVTLTGRPAWSGARSGPLQPSAGRHAGPSERAEPRKAARHGGRRPLLQGAFDVADKAIRGPAGSARAKLGLGRDAAFLATYIEILEDMRFRERATELAASGVGVAQALSQVARDGRTRRPRRSRATLPGGARAGHRGPVRRAHDAGRHRQALGPPQQGAAGGRHADSVRPARQRAVAARGHRAERARDGAAHFARLLKLLDVPAVAGRAGALPVGRPTGTSRSSTATTGCSSSTRARARWRACESTAGLHGRRKSAPSLTQARAAASCQDGMLPVSDASATRSRSTPPRPGSSNHPPEPERVDDDGDRISITDVNGTVARFEMTYSPPEAGDKTKFGPPLRVAHPVGDLPRGVGGLRHRDASAHTTRRRARSSSSGRSKETGSGPSR